MNIVGYVGNLTANVELKQTPQGVAVATFTVAVKRPFKKDVTDYFRCVAWRNDAEFISRYFHKGDYISVKGYNTTRSYDKQVGGDTVKIQVVELLVEKAEFCGSTSGSSHQGAGATPQYGESAPQFTEIPPDEDLPF